MAEGSREAIRADDGVVSAAEVRELKRQVRELQRVLGKKTMENEILREAVKIVSRGVVYETRLGGVGHQPVITAESLAV